MTARAVTRSKYDEATVERIYERLRAGESLLRISKDPNMPSQRTLSNWVAKNHRGFAEKYLDAKRVAAHFLAEKALEEAFNAADDFYLDDEGRPVFDGHHVQRSKLIVDTIKWEVSKMLPKLYGDKLTQELGLTGDLAKLLEAASNRDTGLPPPIDGEYDELPNDPQSGEQPLLSSAYEQNSLSHKKRVSGGGITETAQRHDLHGRKSGPSTPSNHHRNRRRKRRV